MQHLFRHSVFVDAVHFPEGIRRNLRGTLTFIPEKFVWSNYREVFAVSEYVNIPLGFLNTLLIAVPTVSVRFSRSRPGVRARRPPYRRGRSAPAPQPAERNLPRVRRRRLEEIAALPADRFSDRSGIFPPMYRINS